MSNTETPVGSDEIRKIIKSQYHASLAMLRETIERCPEELWMSTASTNAFWQIAYHAVFFAHLYVLPNAQAFRPWAEHQKDTQNEDGLAGPPDSKSSLPLIPKPYMRSQVLTYLGITDGMVDEAVNSLDIHNPDCGFPWYKNITKLEHLFISIRHIQHHGGPIGRPATQRRGSRNTLGWCPQRISTWVMLAIRGATQSADPGGMLCVQGDSMPAVPLPPTGT